MFSLSLGNNSSKAFELYARRRFLSRPGFCDRGPQPGSPAGVVETSTKAACHLTLSCKRNPAPVVLLAFALTAYACTAIQPPSAMGPRTTEPIYPVLLTEDTQRRETSLILFNQLRQQQGLPERMEVHLQPVTATIQSLAANSGLLLYLPKVGIGPAMNEEGTREALRRFINEWRRLIGADPSQLSLVGQLDQPDGTKLANYEQRPFRYPLRGDYGKLQIHFGPERRVLNVTSTCIPDTERMQTELAAVAPQIKWEDALKRLQNNGIIYTDANGTQQTYRLTANNSVDALGLVIYVLPSKTRTDAVEFHLGWELAVTDAPVQTVYVDAVKNEIIAVR
jgi:hypothetical protein